MGLVIQFGVFGNVQIYLGARSQSHLKLFTLKTSTTLNFGTVRFSTNFHPDQKNRKQMHKTVFIYRKPLLFFSV